jgi:hypothetical protein
MGEVYGAGHPARRPGDSENRSGATHLDELAGVRVQHRYDNWAQDLR